MYSMLEGMIFVALAEPELSVTRTNCRVVLMNPEANGALGVLQYKNASSGSTRTVPEP